MDACSSGPAVMLTAPAIGVDPEVALSPYPSEVIELASGDLVVFFTDGITELRDARGAFFEDAIPDLLAGLHDRPAPEVVAALLDGASRFAAQPPADDIALVCLRLLPLAGTGERSSSVAPGKDSDDDGGRRET